MFEFEINGDSHEDPQGVSWDELQTVEVRPALLADHVCRLCNRELTEYPDHFAAEDDSTWTTECPKNPPASADSAEFGPHAATPVPLSWLDAARIKMEPGDDHASVMLVINGSPLTLSVHRVNGPGNENHGKLILTMPYPDAPGQLPLRQISNSGGFVLG